MKQPLAFLFTNNGMGSHLRVVLDLCNCGGILCNLLLDQLSRI